MRYSILGFSQKIVCSLNKTIKRDGKADFVLKLDMTDLLILQQLADFPNRKKTKKQIVDDKLFFWVDYKELLEELPILDIKKQALRDRLDKMVELKVLEKAVVNFDRLGSATCFRMGDNYETLLYSDDTKQSTTQGCVADYTGGGSELQDKNNNKENNTNKTFTPLTPQWEEQTSLFGMDADEEKAKEKKTSKKFVKPTIEEIYAYCRERNNTIDAESFFNFYESKGWLVGKSPMKDWKAAVRTWEKNRQQAPQPSLQLQANKYEMIDEQGNRYYLQGYGKHKVIIPTDAPPRPSETMFWSNFTKSWYQP